MRIVQAASYLTAATILVGLQASAADVCPLYFSGQMNGVYYYYCLPKPASGACTGANPSSGTSLTPKVTGCSTTCDTIRFLETEQKGLRPLFHTPGDAYLRQKCKPHKNNGEPGEGEVPTDTFLRGSGNISVSGDGLILKVAKNGGTYLYFRALTITHTPPTASGFDPFTYYIAQEVDESGATQFDTNWEFDGAATGTGNAANRQHVLKNKDTTITKRIQALSATPRP